MDINNMIRGALTKLGDDSKPQRNGVFAGLIPLNNVGLLKSEIYHLEKANEIGVELYYNILGQIDNLDEIREKLKVASDQDCFLENGKRWMRMILTGEPIHIAIVARIKCPTDEFTEPYIFLKLSQILEIAEANWPLPKRL